MKIGLRNMLEDEGIDLWALTALQGDNLDEDEEGDDNSYGNEY
jgi:hypothetical protein